jgi:hypothetical protein
MRAPQGHLLLGAKVAHEARPTMTWYQARRHSFVSRHLSRGASLDEVSVAVATRRPSSRSASPITTAPLVLGDAAYGLGLGAKPDGGRVVATKP